VIDTLAIENYRSLRRLVIPLAALNVVTGANGSGKSSLYGALRLLADGGFRGFLVLGGIFLCVTGAEALYADMGHFGKRPIRMAWSWIVFPSLVLNYAGQCAIALRGEPITVAGDGSQTRSVCYVDDLVNGIVRMLQSDLPGPVNLGNPHELSVLELAELIRDLAGSSSSIEFVALPQDDPLVRRPDITVATRDLGWSPQVDVEDGLRRTIDWFRTHPDLVGIS